MRGRGAGWGSGDRVARTSEAGLLADHPEFAVEVRRALQGRGYRADPFHVVMREFPEWTRERWGRAVEGP